MEGLHREEPLLNSQNIVGGLRTLNPGYIHSTRHECFQRRGIRGFWGGFWIEFRYGLWVGSDDDRF